jgi:hypothetical protein
MKHSAIYTRSTLFSFRYSKRMWSGLLIITLLAIQARIILEGCLVLPYLPASQSMEHMNGSCSEPASSNERVCLAQCEHAVNKPKLIGEIPLLDAIVGLSTIVLMIDSLDGLSLHTAFSVSSPAIGPPLYLLFLRLLIPIPTSHY